MKTFMAILLVPMVSSHLWMASLTLLTNTTEERFLCHYFYGRKATNEIPFISVVVSCFYPIANSTRHHPESHHTQP